MEWEENFQDQIEEIESIKAIYEEEIVVQKFAESPGQENQFQLVLPIELPEDGITLNACIKESNKKQIIGNYNLNYLPPITLSFTLPPNYPSDQAPNFSISAEWLTKENLSIICKEFDSLCEANQSCPCIFVLCNWIQYDCLHFLFPNDEIDLYQENQEDNESFPEDRAKPQCQNIQDTIMNLIQNHKQEKMIKFKQTNHTCNLCFEEKEGKQFTMMPCCENSFCNECLHHMCNSLVKNGSIDLLKCPNCNLEFHPNFLQLFLNKKQMERWERLTLQRTLDTMSDVRYCPRCEAATISEDNFAQCPLCSYAFCCRCMGDYHVSSSCDEMAVLMKKARQSKDFKSEMKSLRAIQKQARKCPNCHIFISRTEGCNKIVCSNCGIYFCYACGKQIQGYDHFNTTGGRGGCKVFDEVTDDMLFFYAHFQGDNPNQGEDGNIAQFRFHLRKNCPSCGQQNFKDGRNNDIRCFNCGKHFCFLCREKIKGTTHFTTTNCVQHSDWNLN